MEKQDLEKLLAPLTTKGKQKLIYTLVAQGSLHDPEHYKTAAEYLAREIGRPTFAHKYAEKTGDRKFQAQLYEEERNPHAAAYIYRELGDLKSAALAYLKAGGNQNIDEAEKLAKTIQDNELLLHIYKTSPVKVMELENLLEKTGK